MKDKLEKAKDIVADVWYETNVDRVEVLLK